jgi:hypothetical protein
MPKEIAAAMQDASRIDPVARADLGARARKQIEECYSVQASVIGTTKVLGLE